MPPSPSFSDLDLDALGCICDAVYNAQKSGAGDTVGLLGTFSLTNNRIRQASLPNLFRSITVASTTRESTTVMLNLRAAPHLTKHIRAFSLVPHSSVGVSVFKFSNTATSNSAEARGPTDTEECAVAFVQLLGNMPALTSLVFDPHPYLVGKIDVAVSRSLLEATLPLPDVRSLSTSCQCYALAGVFPRVARLSLDIRQLEEEDALRWSTASRNVTNLALNSPVIWGPVVQTLVSGMVHIEELTFTEHISLENDLALFSSLEAVTSLNLPRLHELYLGYPTPYGDPDADLEAHLTQDERERKQQKLQQLADDARMKAKDIARRIFPCIRILRIEGDCVYEFTV